MLAEEPGAVNWTLVQSAGAPNRRIGPKSYSLAPPVVVIWGNGRREETRRADAAIDGLRSYRREWVRFDLLAGLTAAVVIPQANRELAALGLANLAGGFFRMRSNVMPEASHGEGLTAKPGPVMHWSSRIGVALVAGLATMALPFPTPRESHAITAYAVGITVLCVLTFRVLSRPRREEMQSFIREQDHPRWGPLVGAGLLALVSLAVVVYLLHIIAHQAPLYRSMHLVVSLYDVVMTWGMLHILFAVNYAALYYEPSPEQPDQPAGGLVFPDDDLTPDYWDFLYFAFTIAMCYQTSDVSLTRPVMRWYTLIHSIFAYLYGVGILSVLIAAVAGDL
jgi:uncharacterized membrane protein